MATKASNKKGAKAPGNTPPVAQTAAQLAHIALLPLVLGLQKLTDANQQAAGSRSAEYVRIIGTLHDTSPDRIADGIKVFGDGKKGTDAKDGVKGSVVDALMAEVREAAKVAAVAKAKADGKPEAECIAAGISAAENARVHVNVRNELSKCRDVYAGYGQPTVREAAEKSGLRAAYNILHPRKTDSDETPAEVVVAKPAGSAMERVAAILAEADGFDGTLNALRQYFARAADSIGLAKLAEVEVHLMSKTKKTGS